MKFILSRTDDYKFRSMKWVLGYGFLFWLISRLVSMGLIIGCTAIYEANGINPASLTRFMGNPETAKSLDSIIYVVLTICFVAPLLEERIFRLGLSFRKWQIAVAFASIPVYILWQHWNSMTVAVGSICAVGAVSALLIVYCFTTKSLWLRLKLNYYRLAIWVSAFAFGLIHLIAFSNHNPILWPYMLCIVSVPFFAGCAITYYRVNLGFWWGVGLHVFNNLPGVFVIMSL